MEARFTDQATRPRPATYDTTATDHRAAMDSPSSTWAVSPPGAPAISATSTLTAAAIFLLFLALSFGLIFLHSYCFSAEAPAPSARQLRAQMVAPPPPPRGVDPVLLRSLPVTVYRADVVGAEVECAVCLAGLEDGEEARFLPRCGHGFHAQCVDRWLAAHTTCPLCRVAVDGKPDALPSTSLPPVPAEQANYAGNLPASVLLGVSDQATLAAATTVPSDGGGPSTLARSAVLVIDVPEPRTPRDATKSPGVGRLRSVKRLWSFGRQGPSASTTPRAGGSGTVDVERGISNTCATPRAPV